MAIRDEKDLEKVQKNIANQKLDENKAIERKSEAQQNAPVFLQKFRPKVVDEAQAQMKRAFANADANEETYRNATKEANPDRYGDIDIKHPGEVDGKADNAVELKDEETEKVASKLPKLKPPGSTS